MPLAPTGAAMTVNHRGGDGNDDREARAVYHEILADAQALFMLLFGGGPPAPADLSLFER